MERFVISTPRFYISVQRYVSMFFFLPSPGLRSPLLILIFPCVLAGGMYRERLRKRYNQDVAEFGTLANIRVSQEEFDSGLFDCFVGRDAHGLAFFNLLCCPVRMAVNGSATGFSSFWFIIIVGVFFLPLVPIMGYIMRLHIRAMFGMSSHPVSDFFAWLCCYCCALTQESKLLNREFENLTRGVRIEVGRVV